MLPESVVKGVVFTELIEMVESRFGLETADAMLDPKDLPSGGIYTATGTYAHAEVVTLLTRLSGMTGASIPDLLYAYGEHLFVRFHAMFPTFFQKPRNSFEFLASINDTIHTEVRKLYPDAELPQFSHEMTETGAMRLVYQSPRGLADFAAGLIAGCARHFGEHIVTHRTDLSDGAGRHVVFLLEKASKNRRPESERRGI